MKESVEQLYAFYYETEGSSWRYNPREEFARMGLGTRTKAWRFTDVNKDYEVGEVAGDAER
jgi:myotubularin-related protein 6/7/8